MLEFWYMRLGCRRSDRGEGIAPRGNGFVKSTTGSSAMTYSPVHDRLLGGNLADRQPNRDRRSSLLHRATELSSRGDVVKLLGE